MRTLAISPAAFLGYMTILVISATNTVEVPAQNFVAESNADKIADQLNRQQLSRGSVGSVPLSGGGRADEVGILFLRGDGGDPNALRLEATDNLVFVARQNGAGHVYQNGKEVELNPAVMESISEIAAAHFADVGKTQATSPALPTTALSALDRVKASGITPRVTFAHVINRDDTARVSEHRAVKILALREPSAGGEQKDVLEAVRTVMRLFGLRSDVCDTSADPRCDLPGVREAFATIKREETLQRASDRQPSPVAAARVNGHATP
jgi:hypothetical protein